MRYKTSFIFLLIVSLLLPVSLHAETIVLKSGKTLEGEIIAQTDDYIKVSFERVPLTYYLDDIESIDGQKTAVSADSQTDSLRVGLNSFLKKGFEYASKGEFKEAKKRIR